MGVGGKKAACLALACAGLAMAPAARADLNCWPAPLAVKGEVSIRMCVDALDDRMIVVSNESRGLEALPVIAGCALTFADGSKKIVRWKPSKMPPLGEARERGPLKGLPEPVSAACEIEKVRMTLEGEDEPAPTVKIPGRHPKLASKGKKTPPTMIIRPVLHPELVIDGPAPEPQDGEPIE